MLAARCLRSRATSVASTVTLVPARSTADAEEATSSVRPEIARRHCRKAGDQDDIDKRTIAVVSVANEGMRGKRGHLNCIGQLGRTPPRRRGTGEAALPPGERAPAA